MESRTNNTFKNTFAAMIEQLVYNVMSFVCRTVFVYTLGKTYLGFSGLFGDILTLLSLSELGVGTAILYSMYKPMARQNYAKVAALLNLYKKLYHSIGVFVSVVGFCLTPFLDFFISDMPNMPEIPIIYLLYLANTALSYFFVYKKSILIASQRSRTCSLIYSVVTTIQNLLQIIFLIVTHNFIIYLIIQVLATAVNNIIISYYVDRRYTYLQEYKDEKLDATSRNLIFTNVKAMFLSKVSSAVVTSTDNILISKFVSTVVLGLYSNYTLFTTMIRTIVSKIFEALTGSVGNLVASESTEHVYTTFCKIWFVNYWLVAFCSIMLFSLVNPFIRLWIGEDYLLDPAIVMIICMNLYMRLIRNTFLTFNDAYGHFIQLRIKCIVEAIINLVVSLVLVLPMEMGIFGVLFGTFISNVATNFWYEPYLLFNKKFNISLFVYLKNFILYFLVMAVSASLMYYLCNILLVWNNWMGFFVKVFLCCIIINGLFYMVFGKTKEFEYLRQIFNSKIIIRLNRK